MTTLKALKQWEQPRRVLAIHHVNDENNVGFAQIILDRAPLIIRERCAKVVRRHAQIESVPLIDFLLGVPQRRQ